MTHIFRPFLSPNTPHLQLTKKKEINFEKTLAQLDTMLPDELKAPAIEALDACKTIRNRTTLPFTLFSVNVSYISRSCRDRLQGHVRPDVVHSQVHTRLQPDPVQLPVNWEQHTTTAASGYGARYLQ